MSMIETTNDVKNLFLSRREITCNFRGLGGKLKKSEAVDMITKELKLDGKIVIAMNLKNDGSQRFTESDGAQGEIGLLEGAQVVNTALDIIKSQR